MVFFWESVRPSAVGLSWQWVLGVWPNGWAQASALGPTRPCLPSWWALAPPPGTLVLSCFSLRYLVMTARILAIVYSQWNYWDITLLQVTQQMNFLFGYILLNISLFTVFLQKPSAVPICLMAYLQLQSPPFPRQWLLIFFFLTLTGLCRNLQCFRNTAAIFC